jgi:hypothetical protein
MIFKAPQPKNLAEWLEIATDGLAAPGRERITREIEAHYAAAVESHLAQCESEPVAQVSALEELGDAKTARRSFRKRHLTKQQEDWLEEFRHEGGSRIWLAIFLLLGFAMEATVVIKLHPKQSLLETISCCGVIFLVCMVLPTVTFWRLRQPENKSNLPSVSAIAVTQMALTCMGFVLLAFVISRGFVFLFFLPAWSINLIRSFRAWKKIHRSENPLIGKSGLA